MADPSGAPRRVSMAYILGFSNKPFKDGGPPAPSQPPPPRHPGVFKQMVTTPGGVIEWAASDGRRGRLTGPGKPRLTSNNLAQVPPGKTAVNAGSRKDATGGDDAKNNTHNDDGWTAEQDKKLLGMKAENKSWDEIVKEVGKDFQQCKIRFEVIKPINWRPAENKGGGVSGKQKQKKQKGEKDQKDGEKKEGEKKDEASATNGWDAFAGDTGPMEDGAADSGSKENGGSDPWNEGGDGGWDPVADDSKSNNGGDPFNGGDSGGVVDWNRSGDNKEDKNGKSNDGGKGMGGQPGNNKGHKDSKAGGNSWETGNGESGGHNPMDDGWGNGASVVADPGASWNDLKKDNGPGSNSGSRNKGGGFNDSNKNDVWGAAPAVKSPPNKTSAPRSNKSASHTRPKQHSPREPERLSTTAPAEYELKPDSTFSADDLRLVARILQQDYQMVWNRVSWRFRDKTGRDLHPEVFEEKITGRVEREQSKRSRK
ncbi:hypothetical protein N0V95_007403 [Ascochyta clinopodiicola]|nr:hypothetical protein N0V95_007403 [Ascochyta clinopodiicola]